MDREPLGWSVKRHVVDVTFRELDLPFRVPVERFVLVVQAPEEDARDGRLEVAASIDTMASGARSGGPSPAL